MANTGKNLSIFFVVADNAGCGQIRMLHPAKALSEAYPNWNIEAGFAPNPHKLTNGTYDLVVIQRFCTPEQLELTQALSALPGGPGIVYEIDDLLLDVHPSNTNAYEYYRRPFIRSGLKDCMRLADVMTCSTVPLATALAEFNPNVVVLPNYISSSFLNPRPFSPTPGPVSVGWAGGSSHRADIRLVATALRRAQEANAFGFVSIGHNWTKMLDLADSTYLGWTSRVSDYVASLNFDIGIAPLVANHFNGCKSPIKAMEYGARAIPVVASNVEPYASYVVHGETGFLANDDDEWVEYLTQLSQDRYLRYRLGMGNYELAKANTLEAHIEARAQAYQRTVAHLPAIRQSKATFNAGVRAKAKLSLPGL